MISAPWLLLTAGALLVIYAGFVALLIRAGRGDDARALAGFIPDCIGMLRRLLRDHRVPTPTKVLLIALIGYLAMPFDLVPDFIPVAGQLDDAIVVAFVMRRLLRSAGPDVVREQWRGPETSLSVLLRMAGHPAPAN